MYIFTSNKLEYSPWIVIVVVIDLEESALPGGFFYYELHVQSSLQLHVVLELQQLHQSLQLQFVHLQSVQAHQFDFFMILKR